jgi:transcriptional regulator with XRE-family HTH domain
MIRAARVARGWTVDELSVALGWFGTGERRRVLARGGLTRLEAGQRALTIEEAWRFLEVFDDLDVLVFLLAADVIDADTTPEFRAQILEEATRRRETFRLGGHRRRSDRGLRSLPVPGGVASQAEMLAVGGSVVAE